MRSAINGWGALALTYAVMGLAMSCYLGCGGEAYEQDAIGQADQPVIAQPKYGWRQDTGGHACGTGPASQKCVLPNTKTVKFCVSGHAMTAAQKTEAEADVDAILPTFTSQHSGGGWSFSRSCQGTPTVTIVYGSVSGGAASAVNAYVKVSNSTLADLTEIFIIGGTAGQWYLPQGTVIVTVDRAKVVANHIGLVDQQQRVRRHAIYAGMAAGGVGLGFTGVHTNRITSIAVSPNTAKSLSVSSQEVCRAKKYDRVTDPGFAWIEGDLCP